MTPENPTKDISLDFAGYIAAREQELSAHVVNGALDYCFSLDRTLHQRLDSITLLRKFAASMVAFHVKLQKQLKQLLGVAVGPNQFPKLHAMGEECARRLGIGVPEIFIEGGLEPNAYTYAFEDREPIVVLTRGLVDVMNEQELLFIIGHECGHIHNMHGAYQNMVVLTASNAIAPVAQLVPGMAAVLPWLDKAMGLFLNSWSRAAEVTCDRAGLICCGDLQVACRALIKLHTGHSNLLKDVNLEAYSRQIEAVQSTPVKFVELDLDHPIIPKRIEALRHFARCETLFSWRPALRSTEAVASAAEVDKRCEEFIRVLGKGYKVLA